MKTCLTVAALVGAVLPLSAGLGVADTKVATGAEMAFAACSWQAEQLPLPAGTVSGRVEAVDYRGRYVGVAATSATGFPDRVVAWDRNGRIDHVAEVGGTVDVVEGSRSGFVLVNVHAKGGRKAYRLDGIHMEPLPLAQANGVNDRGDVVGSNNWNEQVKVPADRPGTVEKLTADRGGFEVSDIDADGLLLGTSKYPDGHTGETAIPRAIVVRDGKSTLVPHTRDHDYSTGNRIRDGIVLASLRPVFGSDSSRDIVWNSRGAGEVPAILKLSKHANDINRRGTIVGQAENGLAAMWHGSEQTYLRPALGIWSEATAVDDQDVVVGYEDRGRQVPLRWRCV